MILDEYYLDYELDYTIFIIKQNPQYRCEVSLKFL